MILHLDTDVLVYSIAANDDLREPTQRWLDWHAQQPGALFGHAAVDRMPPRPRYPTPIPP
jgi:hypothetical protein